MCRCPMINWDWCPPLGAFGGGHCSPAPPPMCPQLLTLVLVVLAGGLSCAWQPAVPSPPAPWPRHLWPGMKKGRHVARPARTTGDPRGPAGSGRSRRSSDALRCWGQPGRRGRLGFRWLVCSHGLSAVAYQNPTVCPEEELFFGGWGAPRPPPHHHYLSLSPAPNLPKSLADCRRDPWGRSLPSLLCRRGSWQGALGGGRGGLLVVPPPPPPQHRSLLRPGAAVLALPPCASA